MFGQISWAVKPQRADGLGLGAAPNRGQGKIKTQDRWKTGRFARGDRAIAPDRSGSILHLRDAEFAAREGPEVGSVSLIIYLVTARGPRWPGLRCEVPFFHSYERTVRRGHCCREAGCGNEAAADVSGRAFE
ncbi:hypothetical protein SBBP2_440009 [Burkholderiales bacterium]|nr:hypothetical protein SBBP2_440009 [Burkholderiales bacterium]